jgi:hypothetical protein
MNTLPGSLGAALSLPDATLMPFALAILVAALAVYGLLRWAMRSGREGHVRVRVYCPVHRTRTHVLCRLGPRGAPLAIERCDLTPLDTCDADCLSSLGARRI